MSEREVSIPVGRANVLGTLAIPEGARGVVCFAHGSGSSRFSGRNRQVARVLREAGLATLLVDLLTMEEEREDAVDARLRFDIPLLAKRVVAACDWLGRQPDTVALPVGLFGASTGAAAALIAAAERPDLVRAVVSRGGRPDLAGEALPRVRAKVLLLVGGKDYPVIAMNRDAAARMTAPHELVIVPGATHLFEEPGTLEEVAARASEFLVEELGALDPAHVYRITAFYENPTDRTIPDGAVGTIAGVFKPDRDTDWPAADPRDPFYRRDLRAVAGSAE